MLTDLTVEVNGITLDYVDPGEGRWCCCATGWRPRAPGRTRLPCRPRSAIAWWRRNCTVKAVASALDGRCCGTDRGAR